MVKETVWRLESERRRRRVGGEMKDIGRRGRLEEGKGRLKMSIEGEKREKLLRKLT